VSKSTKPPMFPGRPMNHRLVIIAVQVPLPPPESRVLQMLATHAHADGTSAFPSADTLATCCCMGVRSVHRALRVLETCGWIIPVRRGGGRELPNNYTLAVERMLNALGNQANPAPFDDQNPANLAEYPDPETLPNLHENPAKSARKPCQLGRRTITLNKNHQQASGAVAPTRQDSFEGLPSGVAGWLKTLEPKPVAWEGRLIWHTTDMRWATQRIAEALKLGTMKKWPKFWEPLARWIREGFTVSQIAYQIKRQLEDSETTAKDVGSLAYFDARLREIEHPGFRPSHHTLEQMQEAQQPTQVAPAATDCLEKEAVPATAAPEPTPVQVPAIQYPIREWALQAAKKAGKSPLHIELYKDETGWHWCDRPQVSPEEEERVTRENVARQLSALGIDPDEFAKRRAEAEARSQRIAEMKKQIAEGMAAAKAAAAGD
jgi:hypothetical protein